MIKGPDVNICNDCVSICADYLSKDGVEKGGVDEVAEEPSTIVRAVTLPPEYFRPGLALVGYFAVLLGQKYPHLQSQARLELKGYMVRLIIVLQEGDKPAVQKLLDEYGLALQGQVAPRQLIMDSKHAEELAHQIRLTEAELTPVEGSEALSDATSSNDPYSVEKKIARLHNALGWVFRREIEDVQELFGNY